MSNMTGSVLTAAGRKLQAKVEAGKTLAFTKIKLGDGSESASDVDSLTNLVNPKLVVGISSVTSSDDTCTITGLIVNSNVSTGFYAREAGIFATDPDDGEILYAICLDPNPDFVPPATAAVIESVTFSMVLSISNVANVAVTIDPNGLTTVDMLNSAARIMQRSTSYALGVRMYDKQLKPGLELECTTAGTTAATNIDLSAAAVGSTYTDGTVGWTVVKASITAEMDAHKKDSEAHPNLLAGSTFGKSIINHLLGSTLASLVSAVTTDSLFSKLLQLALSAAGLKYNIAANGYICFGSLFGGLILQWGNQSIISTAGSKYTFPVSFSSTPNIIAGSSRFDGSLTSVTVYQVSTSDFYWNGYMNGSSGGIGQVAISFCAFGN